jgi:hypothetical protein
LPTPRGPNRKKLLKFDRLQHLLIMIRILTLNSYLRKEKGGLAG